MFKYLVGRSFGSVVVSTFRSVDSDSRHQNAELQQLYTNILWEESWLWEEQLWHRRFYQYTRMVFIQENNIVGLYCFNCFDDKIIYVRAA